MGLQLRLTRAAGIDPAILDLPAERLHEAFSGPTLIDLSKPDQQPLFVAVLLHGNEISGWDAVRFQLKEQSVAALPSMYLFIGNIEAAKFNRRHLNGQLDFNRVWSGENFDKTNWAQEVMEEIIPKRPWFMLDIHNTTAPNPHHSVISDTRDKTLSAAREFSDIAVYAHQPHGFLSRRCSEFTTSITIEVGMPTDDTSTQRAQSFLKRVVTQGSFPSRDSTDLRIFRSKIRVVLEDAAKMNEQQVPRFASSLRSLNFERVARGTKFATLKPSSGRLIAFDEEMNDVTDTYLDINGDAISLRNDVVMSMYTEDPRIALQDCVCYFLEPWST